ncbi:MAG: glycosyltransferase family 2 protein [Chloroflexi bacterium]|nr:glycosyltransferase family 2 protein [Chloroflexota bacterium]
MAMSNISVCIIVKDEENLIGQCLESVKELVDEIIIVDQNSTDKTLEICRRYTDKIYQYDWDDSFANKRNYASSMANNDWIFSIDADQVVTTELVTEIRNAVQSTRYDAYYIRRINNIYGKFMWPEEHIWLYRKSKSNWVGRVHEQNQVNGKIGHLSGYMLHYAQPNISHTIRGLNLYSDIDATMLYEQHSHGARLYNIIFLPFRDFVVNYFIGSRFIRWGARGLIFCILLSIYRFIVQSKYYELCHLKGKNPYFDIKTRIISN